MISENLFIILIIFIVIGIIIYCFYNNHSNIPTSKEYFVDITSPKKKVTFNDKIKCVYYKKTANKKSSKFPNTYEQTPYEKASKTSYPSHTIGISEDSSESEIPVENNKYHHSVLTDTDLHDEM